MEICRKCEELRREIVNRDEAIELLRSVLVKAMEILSLLDERRAYDMQRRERMDRNLYR